MSIQTLTSQNSCSLLETVTAPVPILSSGDVPIANKATRIFLRIVPECPRLFIGYEGMREASFIHCQTLLYSNTREWFDITALPIATEASTISILIGRCTGKASKVDLPPLLQQNFLAFLRSGRPDPAFCCFDFISSLFGTYTPATVNSFDIGAWTITEWNEAKLAIGDVVAMITHAACLHEEPQTERSLGGRWKHAALYLGTGLYLSLMGRKGPLMVTTMEHLKRGYETDHVLALNMRTQSPGTS